jgi:putative oxidoreductase
MNNSVVLVAARALLSAVFLVAGVRKIMIWGPQVAYFTKLGFPMPEVMTVLAIAIELGAGLALLVGWRTRQAAWLLALFVLIATFMAHRFWEFDAATQANQMNHFLKNLAIIGGLAFVASFGPGSAAVDKSG